MDRVIVKSKYDSKIHKRFYLFHMFRRSYMIYFVLALAALIIYMAVRQTIANPDNRTMLIGVWAMAAITISITPLLMFIRIHSAIKREKKDRGDSIEVLEFTKDKIVRKLASEGTIVINWHYIDGIYEVRDAYYIYINENQGLAFKKDCITEGDNVVLRKLIVNSMKPNKRGKVNYKKKYKGE